MLFPPFLSVCSPARRMVRDRRSAETQMEGRNQARETESGMVIKASRWAAQVSGVGIFARSARSVSPVCWDGWPNMPRTCHVCGMSRFFKRTRHSRQCQCLILRTRSLWRNAQVVLRGWVESGRVAQLERAW